MTLLDRFRRRPAWEHDDPSVRLDGVRELSSAEQDLLTALAQGDSDARVRRAALRKVSALGVVVSAAREDADEGVREEAHARLLEVARGSDEASARTAFVALEDTRSILALAKGAAVAALRIEAAGRLTDAHALANLAKLAEDSAVRRHALSRVAEAPLLLDIALKTEHKDIAIAAVDRIDDLETLRVVADKARNGGAARRAAARLEALGPKPEPVPVPPMEVPEELPAEEPAPAAEAVAPSAPEATPEPAELEPSGSVPGDASAASPPVAASEPAAPSEPSPADVRQAQEKERRERGARIEALAARLETLASAENLTLRHADAALREVRIAHEELGKVPVKLAQRVRAARAAVFAKSQPLREAEDWTRWSNAAIQEQLCERVEGLVGREDFEKVSVELRDCDQRWSDARHAPRDQAEALRKRYQVARAKVKERVDAFFEKRNETERENLKHKQALCEQAEALAESTDWVKSAEAFQALQARWKEIGPAPRTRAEAVWQRFRTACDRFFTRKQEDLKQRKGEWATNLAAKTVLIERAEALADSRDWELAVAEIKRLQLEWKSIGAVRRSKSEEIWQRFRKAGDVVFERYKHRDEIAAARQREQREALCVEIESLASAPAAAEGLATSVAALQLRSRQASGLPPAEEASFTERFVAARNKLIGAWPEAFKGTDLDPEANRVRKEKLLVKVEALAARAETAPPDAAALSGADLAARLKEALASNTMGGKVDAEARRKADADEIESVREAWRRLGPVPGEAGAALEARFQKACAPFASRTARPRKAASRIGAGIA